MTKVPADHAVRGEISDLLDETLFVEAGAGSGKSTALVARVLSLVRSGIPITNIAAITFTEKAAAELRDKLRHELGAAGESSADIDLAAALETAAADVDLAAISTLHSFAQRLLGEHPIEAKLPPGIEVLDEIGSDIEFDERWRKFRDELLEDPGLEAPLQVLWSANVRDQHFRDLARIFEQNWDLVSSRVAPSSDFGTVGIDALVDRFDDIAARRADCADHGDKLFLWLDELAVEAAALRRSSNDVDRFLMLRAEWKGFKGKGAQANWGGKEAKAQVQDAIASLVVESERWRERVLEGAIRQIAAAIAEFTLAEASRRQADGRLNFHDLLVLCRRLLRDPDHGHAVRQASRARYQRLLLDEFQDTDPIQLELAALLGAEPSDGDETNAWNELSPDPGRLFFVGDPKQSIYRFRRADIGLSLDASMAYGQPLRTLTTNFRSTAGVLDWVNHVFSQLINQEDRTQPAYEPLAPFREDQPDGPAVALLGVEPASDGIPASDLRSIEAASVVSAIQVAISEPWKVRAGDGDDWRDAKLGDICVLLPARTSLPQLESALDKAGIPFRAEASALLYGSAEVRDLLAILRAIDDPTDELALVTAMRSAAFGCGDDDLFDFKANHRGQWNHQRELPETISPEHPVAEAMSWFAKMYDQRTWRAPSEIIEVTLRERKLHEVAFAQGRFRDVWRRYRFVLDQARAYTDAANGSLRDYMMWVMRQAAEGSRVNETVLPESDDDAVRIMTVHASKGLEFPITIVSGMTTQQGRRPGGIQVLFPHGEDTYEIHFRKGVQTDEFDLHKPIDEVMDDAERIRLLYVACTRAVDHLVVSCHRTEKHRRRAADELFEASQGAKWSELEETPTVETPAPSAEAVPIPEFAEWNRTRTVSLAQAARARVTSATAIAEAGYERAQDADDGLKKRGRDLDLPPWQRGRYGSAVGRAVHGALQVLDLAGADELSPVCAAQAEAEGVATRVEAVEALTRSAIEAPIVAEAAAAPHWKEVYVAAPVGGSILEGYIDLVFERGDELVVVDYKTDFVADDDHLADKLERYRLQLGSYVVSLEAATGKKVGEAVFVFCDPDGAREARVDDLAGVAVEASELVSDRLSQ